MSVYSAVEGQFVVVRAAATDTDAVELKGPLVAVTFPEGAPGTKVTLLGACEACPSPPVARRTDGTAYEFPLANLPSVWVVPEELRVLKTVAFRFDAPAGADYRFEVVVLRG